MNRLLIEMLRELMRIRDSDRAFIKVSKFLSLILLPLRLRSTPSILKIVNDHVDKNNRNLKDHLLLNQTYRLRFSNDDRYEFT